MNTTALWREATFPLNGEAIDVGRGSSCRMVVQGMGVSRHHATIRLNAAGPIIEDAGSQCGILINGVPVKSTSLHHGDIITLGVAEIEVHIGNGSLTLKPIRRQKCSAVPCEDLLSADAPCIRIGRDSSNDEVVSHPLVSRFHAELQRTKAGGYLLVDIGSTNGTFVNGRRVRERLLREGDIVQIGPFRFSLSCGRLFRADDGNTITVEAVDISVRSRGRDLLRHVSIGVQPGEFVLVLGPSGAGKTTLINALAGRVAPTEGQVLYNGLPLRRFACAFSSRVGYVSQENLLYSDLTVWETLYEQSILRLPRDSAPLERFARIEEVIGNLDLSSVRHQRIGRLSGGEAKRVHLGIELLSSPTLVFLDEPLAGLDAGLVRRFMELFRSLSRGGRTLVVTTHTLERLEMCDRVAMVHEGCLLYNGKADNMAARLGAGSIAEVYERARCGELSPCVCSESEKISKPVLPALLQRSALQMSRSRSVSNVRQISVLVGRYFKTMTRDARGCLLTAAQIPLITLLLRCVYRGDRDFLPMGFYFSVALAAIWCGGVNTIREIAREWLYFDREYRAGVSIVSFVVSKLIVAWSVAAVQSLMFLALLKVFFAKFSLDWQNAAILAAASLSGALLGLTVSALSANVRQAVAWLPIVFIPQIFFSGIMLPFDHMPAPGRMASRCMISRAVFSLFKQKEFLDMPVWHSSEWAWLLLLCSGLFILIPSAVRLRRFFQKW